jgi:hypothetical protein
LSSLTFQEVKEAILQAGPLSRTVAVKIAKDRGSERQARELLDEMKTVGGVARHHNVVR